MRSLDVIGALRRRWYVLVAGVLATCGLAVAAYTQVGATYELRASAVLLPPSVSVVSPSTRELVNPFLRLDGMDPALAVLVSRMTAEELADRMLEDAPGADYTVTEDPVSQAPVVVVAATSADPDEASDVLDRVTSELPTVLDDLQDQAGITSSARITLLPLVRDDQPERVLGDLLRIEILLVGAGLVATLLVAGLWDAIARSRRVEGPTPTTEAPPTEAPTSRASTSVSPKQVSVPAKGRRPRRKPQSSRPARPTRPRSR